MVKKIIGGVGNVEKLVSKVEKILNENPHGKTVVKLPNLCKKNFDSLKELFESNNYDVYGVIDILSLGFDNEVYSLYIGGGENA